MNDKTMDQIVLDANKFINSEIEKHVFQWIVAAQGIDFANLLQKKLRELVKMEQALKEREDCIEILEKHCTLALNAFEKNWAINWSEMSKDLSKLADLKKRWAEK